MSLFDLGRFAHSAPALCLPRPSRAARSAAPGPPQDQTSIQTGSYGTPGFAAPELLTDGKLTKAADIYSLGLMSESAGLGWFVSRWFLRGS